MKRLGGLTFGVALAVVAFGQAPAVAGPFGSTAEMRDLATLPLVDVQARRVRPVGPRPGGPRYYRGRGGNGAAAAGALIGAAIIGGALIAESQRRRTYVDDGYYYYDDAPTGYAVPSPYYSAPRVRARQPYYGGGYYAPQPLPPAYFNQGGEAGHAPSGFYNQPGGVYYTQPHGGRRHRDPAGGGNMR